MRRQLTARSAPPGPFRPEFWRSPLRGPWLTAVLGLILLIGLPIVILTGLASNVAYDPRLGANALGRSTSGPLDLYLFSWPSAPSWLYAVTQGLHVTVGLALTPVLLVKLWSVIPRLFEWPPVRSPAHALERVSLALLVGGALFEFATGILNIQYWYAFPFSFPQAHYYGAWVFIGAFVTHVALKLATMRSSLRVRAEVLDPAPASPSSPDPAPASLSSPDPAPASLSSPDPAPATLSRRTLLAAMTGGAALLGLQGLGQSAGGPLRALAILLPRGRTRPGPTGFPVNRTAVAAGVSTAAGSASWQLHVSGRRELRLSRAELMALPQHTYDLPIACVEGWSTTQRWSGVRLRDLAALCGAPGAASVLTHSLDSGTYGRATLSAGQLTDPRSLLALRVNGVDLSLDHGYPARVIGPALPGVHCTKWVSSMTFEVSA